jgi:plasmid stabilization system protein ParE
MIRYTVVFSHEARRQLGDLQLYLSREASPAVAKRYTDALVDTCIGLAMFPHRGTPRPEIRPELRTTHHRGRTTIAYRIVESRKEVVVLGIFHGGQDYPSALAAGPDEG